MTMTYTITTPTTHRPDINLTQSAQRELDNRTAPLLLTIDVTFGGFVAKGVSFRDGWDDRSVPINDRLAVMVRTLHYVGGHPMEFESPQREALMPKRVNLDFEDGMWSGTFSWR